MVIWYENMERNIRELKAMERNREAWMEMVKRERLREERERRENERLRKEIKRAKPILEEWKKKIKREEAKRKRKIRKTKEKKERIKRKQEREYKKPKRTANRLIGATIRHIEREKAKSLGEFARGNREAITRIAKGVAGKKGKRRPERRRRLEEYKGLLETQIKWSNSKRLRRKAEEERKLLEGENMKKMEKVIEEMTKISREEEREAYI